MPAFLRLVPLIGLLTLFTSLARAVDDPEGLLTSKGLKKVGNTYVLAGEGELSRAFSAVQRLQKEHAQAVSAARTAEQELAQERRMVPVLTQRRLHLNVLMQNAL